MRAKERGMTAIQRAEGKAVESEGKRDKKRRRRGAGGEDGIVQQSREGKGDGERKEEREEEEEAHRRRQIEAQEGKKGEKVRVVRYS